MSFAISRFFSSILCVSSASWRLSSLPRRYVGHTETAPPTPITTMRATVTVFATSSLNPSVMSASAANVPHRPERGKLYQKIS
jgi:hypothetical protein